MISESILETFWFVMPPTIGLMLDHPQISNHMFHMFSLA